MNRSIVEAKFELFNAKHQDSIVNCRFQTFKVVTACSMYITVGVSLNMKKPDYSMEFVKTVFDVKKMVQGVYANPIVKAAFVNILKSIDFEIKFPLNPVRKIIHIFFFLSVPNCFSEYLRLTKFLAN